MIKTVASIIIWPIWATVFLLGALLYNILMIIFTSKKIHPIARVLCYLFMIRCCSLIWTLIENPGNYIKLLETCFLIVGFPWCGNG